MSMRDHIIKWARENEPVSINEIAEHVQRLFDQQAIAAKHGMDAAKGAATQQLDEARRLYAECKPEALESEKAANALLTAENEAMRAKLAAIGRLCPTHFDDREQLLGAITRILRGQIPEEEEVES